MKFAICNETFQDWPLERGFAFAAECGYEGVEIAPFTIAPYVTQISQNTRSAIRQQAHQAGLEIVGLHWLLAKTEGFHLTSPNAEIRRHTADYLADLCRFCADVEGRVMVFGSPKQRDIPEGISPQQAMEYAAEVFQRLVPVLEKHQVILAVEPLAPSETNFLCTAAEAVELIQRIGSPQVRLHLDCKAMSSEKVPIPDLIRQYHQLLVHFHANDPNRQGPGFGQLDFIPILDALKQVGYQGWVSVEVFDYSPGVERLAKESLQYLQACLKKLPHK
ncbi:MAG: sugar phosphate isomerase/epimerase [Thermoguttaceae bacterium]|nr:sugar phosphate isomerase/epimerase [Thermoguttaceae bacterium]MDW8036418.1 sugar phosphate isomerase/epimerase family protein [Thermoguttaceae bacterium]